MNTPSRFIYAIGFNGLAWILKKDIPNQVKTRAECSDGAGISMKLKASWNEEFLDFLCEIKAITGTTKYYVIDLKRIINPEAMGIIL
jgi:hypothetical protein